MNFPQSSATGRALGAPGFVFLQLREELTGEPIRIAACN
jgi:hypothetical protein